MKKQLLLDLQDFDEEETEKVRTALNAAERTREVFACLLRPRTAPLTDDELWDALYAATEYSMALFEGINVFAQKHDLDYKLSQDFAKEAVAAVMARIGRKGGEANAAVTTKVQQCAVRLATDKRPAEGWKSATEAAESVILEVREFARPLGRNPSLRKVTEWLRGSGIKRGGSTD